jgi:hypothetical protein
MIGWIGAGVGATAFGAIVDQGYSMSQTLSSTAAIYVLIAGLLVLASLITAMRASGPAGTVAS